MENKNVVEKRIKPGIIRRRAKAAPEAPVENLEAEIESISETIPESIASAAPVAEPVMEAEQPAQNEPVTEAITEPEPAAAEAPAEIIAKTTPSAEVQAPLPVAPKKPLTAAEKSRVQGPRELPEGPPIGTIIQLKKPFKKEPPSPAGAEKPKIPLTPEEEEIERKRLKKAPKKKVGTGEQAFGELEGFGRISTVSQIVRLSAGTAAVDRVFQPTRMAKRKKGKSKRDLKTNLTTQPKASKRIIRMEEKILVADLAQQLGIRSAEIVKQLMAMGSMVTQNQYIDFDTASLIAQEYQWEVKRTGFEEQSALKTEMDSESDLILRAPVVTIMGHVDHGKTSLLDAIRSTQVAAGEAGGITQHIGSYRITLGPGRDITFLDTPGHEAFTAMRARGASVTDIVILVVAADDGVMPQTIEAIHHAKAAKVPIIVAVNKIDKPDAKPDVVKRQLSEHGLQSEDWGGDTMFVHVSAKSRQGIEELLEAIFLQAEVLELKANPNKLAKGVIIEARLDKGRGPVATALIQEGTLKIGDAVVAGISFGKIRAMMNDRGQNVDKAGPGVPVEILGLDSVPQASDPIQALEDEKAARQVVEHRQIKSRELKQALSSKMSLEDLYQKMQAGELQELSLILKADVQGSAEALQTALEKIPSDKVKTRVLHSGVGGITESDVMLAKASKGIIIGFNVRPDTKAREIAERENVDVRIYKIIYDVIEDVKKAMTGLLKPTLVEKYLGRAEVRQVFTVSKVGTIAGCYVIDGKIVASAKVRLLRDNVIIHEGKISSLKRFKDDAREVAQNYECGISFEGFNDLKERDLIECYQVDQIQGVL